MIVASLNTFFVVQHVPCHAHRPNKLLLQEHTISVLGRLDWLAHVTSVRVAPFWFIGTAFCSSAGKSSNSDTFVRAIGQGRPSSKISPVSSQVRGLRTFADRLSQLNYLCKRVFSYFIFTASAHLQLSHYSWCWANGKDRLYYPCSAWWCSVQWNKLPFSVRCQREHTWNTWSISARMQWELSFHFRLRRYNAGSYGSYVHLSTICSR